MPTIRKKFKKIDQQELNESKRQWKKLTEALRNEDINTANDAKHEVIIINISRCGLLCYIA